MIFNRIKTNDNYIVPNIIFDTFNDMKLSNILEKGLIVSTLGLKSINDGGNCTYYISNEILPNCYCIPINDLYACIYSKTIRLSQLFENNSTIDLNNIIQYFDKVIIDNNYKLSTTFILKPNKEIIGLNGSLSLQSNDVVKIDRTCENVLIDNLTIISNNNYNGIYLKNEGYLVKQDINVKLSNILIKNANNGIKIDSDFRECIFKNIRIENVNSAGINDSGTDNRFENITISISNKDGILTYGYNNLFIGCKAFCCGYGKETGVGFNLQNTNYVRIVGCESQQNVFGNLKLNNVSNSYIQMTCDSAGWLMNSHNDSVKNIELNGCYSNIININMADGRSFGDVTYCDLGIYSQYINSCGNRINIQSTNSAPNVPYRICDDRVGSEKFSITNDFIVNGIKYIYYGGVEFTCYNFNTRVTEDCVISDNNKLLTYTIPSKGLSTYRVNLDFKKFNNICVYLDEILPESSDIRGSLQIQYNDSQYTTSNEVTITGDKGGRYYSISIKNEIKKLGNVTINAVQLRLIARGKSGTTIKIKNPKIVMY